MDQVLTRLTKLIPPPKKPRFRDVNWDRLEEGIGLTYPKSFKEFVGVYGGCVWFDNLSPFYSQAKTDKEVDDFSKAIAGKLNWLRDNTFDLEFNRLDVALYPQDGGLLPFMIEYNGPIYLWQTDRQNADKWPIVRWMKGPLRVLEGMTIAKMILGWLERDPIMMEVWGDVRDFDAKRLQLTETTEPKKTAKRGK